MSPHSLSLLTEQLKLHEGFRRSAYKDSEGLWTLGYGRLIDVSQDAGVSRIEADYLLANDIADAQVKLDATLPWWRSLEETRQRVMVEWVFQLGLNGVLGFRKALAAIEAGNFHAGAREMLDSKWRTQTPERAEKLAAMMRTGADPA